MSTNAGTSTSITHELHCVSCGYDLRGLDGDSNCPECGSDVQRSLRGDDLRYADPKWLRRIVRGQFLLAVGLNILLLGTVAALILMMTGGILAEKIHLDWEGAIGEAIRFAMTAFIVLGGFGLAAVGCYMVSAQDPKTTSHEMALSARRLGRWGLITAAVLMTAGQILDTSTSVKWLVALSSGLSLLGLIACAIGLVGVLRWLAQLTRRVPDYDLTKRLTNEAEFFRKTFRILLPLILIHRMIEVYISGGANAVDTIVNLISCVMSIAVLLIFVHMISLFTLMIQTSQILRFCKKMAAKSAD